MVVLEFALGVAGEGWASGSYASWKRVGRFFGWCVFCDILCTAELFKETYWLFVGICSSCVFFGFPTGVAFVSECHVSRCR